MNEVKIVKMAESNNQVNYLNNEGLVSFKLPPPPNWKFHLAPNFTVKQTKAPNRFHRFMQRLVFGFRWERIDKK